jgi:hypothetical protein
VLTLIRNCCIITYQNLKLKGIYYVEIR